MKNPLKIVYLLALIVLLGFGSSVYAAHTAGPVTLKDATGTDIAAGSNTPYSPKQSCGTSGCHNYESDITTATKDHGPGTTSYLVPYPQHGVTAGYHFQQGRNLNWGDTQREYFHQADFTSSGGMYGKY
jgi:hypothetical protein